MSYLCLQFGQCGNQLGYELYSVINSDINSTNTGVSLKQNIEYCENSRNAWFRENENGKFIARAVLVDTEKKVIKHLKDQTKSNPYWQYANENILDENSGGAANNWALGYKVKGPRIFESTINLVRKELENCDRLKTIFSLSSSSGGTGSGVGSYVAEKLHDEFPEKSFMNILVLPFSSGEIVLQNYNTLLTLTKLYDSTDAIILMENDSLYNITTSNMRIINSNFSDVNNVIAQQIASVFQPTQTTETITDMINDIVSHRLYKLLSIKSAPYVSAPCSPFEPIPKWQTLRKSIDRTLRENFNIKLNSSSLYSEKTHCKSIGNILFYRGFDSYNESNFTDPSIFDSDSFYANWMIKKKRYVTLKDNRRFHNKVRFVSLISNNSKVAPFLNNCINKAWNTFIHTAYVHQYTKYGFINEDFLEVFLKMELVLKRYKSFHMQT